MKRIAAVVYLLQDGCQAKINSKRIVWASAIRLICAREKPILRSPFEKHLTRANRILHICILVEEQIVIAGISLCRQTPPLDGAELSQGRIPYRLVPFVE